ncbi:hypothetical protein L1987_02788 [Smallanthus sonchifolius]|uniref:Uncharacterized protein n=1 Tax=Smallanthus sonchifolius TaxID=185202 RepID=A0ACB9K909_9ASTR|nr:hypothetical protein L1987_02788 [Smallanthus sonchifolius]
MGNNNQNRCLIPLCFTKSLVLYPWGFGISRISSTNLPIDIGMLSQISFSNLHALLLHSGQKVERFDHLRYLPILLFSLIEHN